MGRSRAPYEKEEFHVAQKTTLQKLKDELAQGPIKLYTQTLHDTTGTDCNSVVFQAAKDYEKLMVYLANLTDIMHKTEQAITEYNKKMVLFRKQFSSTFSHENLDTLIKIVNNTHGLKLALRDVHSNSTQIQEELADIEFLLKQCQKLLQSFRTPHHLLMSSGSPAALHTLHVLHNRGNSSWFAKDEAVSYTVGRYRIYSVNEYNNMRRLSKPIIEQAQKIFVKPKDMKVVDSVYNQILQKEIEEDKRMEEEEESEPPYGGEPDYSDEEDLDDYDDQYDSLYDRYAR